MKRRIKWAKVEFLSLCPRGANRMAVVYKSDDPNEAKVSLETLTKASTDFDEKGELLAVGYPAEIRDAQGDIAGAEVVKEMAYSFMSSGGKLDLRHNNNLIAKERAFVAENFLVQKSDGRFHDWKDAQGGGVGDLTGSWAVVLKVEDPELRKLYRNGGWNGVSFEGRVGLVVEKEGDTMDFEKFLLALKESLATQTATLSKSITDALTPKPAPTPTPEPAKKEDAAPVFKGPLTVENLKKHREAVIRHNLLKTVNLDDPEALAAAIEQLEKEHEAALLSETPEQKIDRLQKENRALSQRVKKQDRASAQPGDTTTAPSDQVATFANGVTVSKADVDLGNSMAASQNKRNGFAAK